MSVKVIVRGLARALTALCFILALAASATVEAEEVIDRFLSDVVVGKDGTLDVVEDITVEAEGIQIKRGILRDFPTDYQNADGTRVRVTFDVSSVERNGNPVKWATERIGNGVRIRIGDPDRLLQPGFHTYRIAYRTAGQVGFFDGYDQLYWNVTGNGWTFPINDAQIRIKLPDGAGIIRHKIFTGPFGSTASNATARKSSGDLFEASTTRRLMRREGFTVAIDWPKGLVDEPTETAKLTGWLADNLGYGVLAATLIGSLAYFWLAWARVGRDPPGGAIVPLFKPPEGLGAACVRYIWKQKFDNQAFSAALVNLAVKGRVKIENDDDEYAITRLQDNGPPLSVSETSLLKSLPQGKLELLDGNHRQVGVSKAALSNTLEAEYNGTMFVKNIGWFLVGAVGSVAGLIAAGLLIPGEEGKVLIFAGLFSAIWWGVLLSAGYGIVSGMRRSSGILSMIGGMFRLLFLVPFVVSGLAVPVLTLLQDGVTSAMTVFLAMAILLGIVNFVFLWLMPAATPAGRRILDQIEGFRMYLSTAEEKRLDALHPPEKTPELFERYLPYAMALDCENEWNKKFTAVLAAAAAAGATAPIWYGGQGSSWNSGGFASGLNNSLSSSIASASSPPGRTSGTGGSSGGGGFSGGGGGGGGGSGW